MPKRPKESRDVIVRPFTPTHGKLVVREHRPFGEIPAVDGAVLNVKSSIIITLEAAEPVTSYGARLEHEVGSETIALSCIDYEDLAEAIEAFDAIGEIGNQIAQQDRPYTEVFYVTRDDVRFGFYQPQPGQRPFVQLSRGATSLYITVEQFFS